MNTLRRIGNFYRLQLELIWHWRPGPRALIRRAIVAFFISLVSLVLTAWLMPSRLIIETLVGRSAAVIFLAVLNLLVRPLILATVAGRSVIALGVLTLVFQVVAVLLLDPFVPGVSLGGDRRIRRRPRCRPRLVRLRASS